MRILKTIYCFILFGLLFPTLSYSQIDSREINKEIDFIINEQPQNVCTIPAYNIFPGDVENVNNIASAQNIDLENKNGGIVYIEGNVYLSPQDIAKLIRKELEDVIGQSLKKELTRVEQNLGDNIKEWKNELKEFGELLKGDKIQIEQKKQGKEILEEFKKHIKFTDCINNDHIDEAIIEVDDAGNKNYFFDLEKIKNDPNYSFVDARVGNFSLAKKFNKYGYISHWKHKNIPFKYTKGKPFKYGFANAETKDEIMILNEMGEEIIVYDKAKVDSIHILRNNRFIVHNKFNFNNETYIVNKKNVPISKGYEKIVPTDKLHKAFYTEELVPFIERDSHKYDGYRIQTNIEGQEKKFGLITSIIDINGREYSKGINCKRTFNQCRDYRGKCNLRLTQLLYTTPYEYEFIVGRINDDDFNYIAIKDVEREETIACGKTKINGYFYPIFYYQYWNKLHEPIIGFKSKNPYNRDKVIFIIDRNNKFSKNNKINIKFSRPIKGVAGDYYINGLNKYPNKRERGLFSLNQNKQIGEYCTEIKQVIPEWKLILYGNNMFVVSDVLDENNEQFADESIGYGVMNYNGLYIIPPVFKSIFYNDFKKAFYITSHFDKEFVVDPDGKCLSNCEEYNSINKEYFTFLSSN